VICRCGPRVCWARSQARADHRAAHLEAVIERGIDRLEAKSTEIRLDGKVIARTVNEQNRKAARR
jgi:hypothetical protein